MALAAYSHKTRRRKDTMSVVVTLVTLLSLLALTAAHPAASERSNAEIHGCTSPHYNASLLETYSDRYDPVEHERRLRALDLDDGDGRGDPGMPGWSDPGSQGGSMLDLVGNGMREPINAIISGRSDPYILSDAGLRDYVRTIGFSFECLDLHLGGLQRANLGDGKGWDTEIIEFRETESWGAPGRWIGACWESLSGGNHFRVWKQNGTLANTGAWFLAVSTEKDLRHHHTIDEDGYNHGRDLLVEAAEAGGRWKIWKWKADVTWREDLLTAGRHGINHNIAQDGRVAILKVNRIFGVGALSFVWPTDAGSRAQARLASTWTALSRYDGAGTVAFSIAQRVFSKAASFARLR